jgi:conjugal transfer pilus assembly protein TraE
MDFERHQNDLRAQRRANRSLGVTVGVLSVCQLLSLAVIVSIVGSERTVIVPPSIDRSFWVAREQASREYLEQMAGFVAWLVLDVSPSTIDWKRNVLLNWVAPDQHAAMKTLMDLEADRLRSHNASTSFLIQQFTTDEKAQSVLVAGRLRRQINGADVGEPETRTYLARFSYAGGRVHIRAFKEMSLAQSDRFRVGTADPGTVAR